VKALLQMANVSAHDFTRQVEEAGDRHDQRQHWRPSPVAGHHPPLGADTAGALTPLAQSVGTAPTMSGAARGHACPACGGSLADVVYEGASVQTCRGCGGCLVGRDDLRRILARREVGFTPEQQRLADGVAAAGNQMRRAARLGQAQQPARFLRCPRCGKEMIHGHYSYDYAIDVDRCAICRVVWFGKEDLEVLQLLTERQVE
jgi:Zn-finger nucleic acid-binding protein